MAFTEDSFSPVGANARRGSTPQQFSYSSPDAINTIKASGYFDEVASLLFVGDWISVNELVGVGTVGYWIIFVLTITDGVVVMDTREIKYIGS